MSKISTKNILKKIFKGKSNKKMAKKVKKKKVKTDASTGSVKINCDSPVWKNKPRCN